MVGFVVSTSFKREVFVLRPFERWCFYMFRIVAFNIEAREARRSKLLRESYWKFEATFDFGYGQYPSFLLLTYHGFMVIKNQTTRLPWITAAVKNCLFVMVEDVVIQGDGDKEVGVKKSLCFDYVLFAFYSTLGTSWTLHFDMFGRKPQNNLPAKLTLMVFEIWHIYRLRILDMLISLLSFVPKLSTFEFLMGLEEMVLVSLIVSYSNCENSKGKTADGLEKDHPHPT
ncbi:hypothetical protein GQ457_02G018800 [Hibiscus cannabinus]